MKTLDEVIDKFEKCNDYAICCDACPYFTEQCACDPDALHYLKIFKSECDRIRGQLEEAREEFRPNDPLTWEELRKMEGEPVFVEELYRNGELMSTGWWLIDYWNDNQICLRDQGGNPWNVHRTSLGRDWQAYRKEKRTP